VDWKSTAVVDVVCANKHKSYAVTILKYNLIKGIDLGSIQALKYKKMTITAPTIQHIK
jgi:hypothetical protein